MKQKDLLKDLDDKKIYRTINQNIPKNSSGYRDRLSEITRHKQYILSPFSSSKWIGALVFRTSLASLTLCIGTIFAINDYFNNRDLNLEKVLQTSPDSYFASPMDLDNSSENIDLINQLID